MRKSFAWRQTGVLDSLVPKDYSAIVSALSFAEARMNEKRSAMVPEAFHEYFVASTGAGAALLGLLFVAVSIAPEQTVMSAAPVERQAVATSTYTALLNAFFLSLVALLPQTNLGLAALVMSLIGLANSFVLAWGLLRHTERKWPSIVRRAAFIVAGLLLYGDELYNAVLLLLSPTNSVPISTLAALLVGIYALGMTRAWQLLGGRGHQLNNWLTPLRDVEERQVVSDTEQPLSATSVRKEEAR
jgi:hypothetical protein